jgi:mono/diheme cytochrome c family protein
MKAVLLLLLPAALGGCDLSMKAQRKTEAQAAPTLWPGGPPRAAAPEGTIATDEAAHDTALAAPPPLTPALLDRGEQRYGVFCGMCHGATGRGDGSVVQRGFPRPAPFTDPPLLAATPAQIVAVISDGKGVMYGFADRIPPRDRWAIAAYVKTLQRAQTEPVR